MSDSVRPGRVAVLAFPGITPFHLAVPLMAFGEPFSDVPQPRYHVEVCAEEPGLMTRTNGLSLMVDAGLEALEDAEMIILPGWDVSRRPSPRLVEAIRAAHARGARIASLCLGAFLLAGTGLLDGRSAVTHWRQAAQLQDDFPQVRVSANELWIDHDDVVTSAGIAAGLDCCIHLIRKDHGADVAAAVARAMVMSPHRIASQAQFIPAGAGAASEDDPVESAMVWARMNLDQPLALEGVAAASGLSRRTFSRRFRARTGLSTGDWLTEQRLDRARQLLEATSLSVEEIAQRCGFGSAAALRLHFRTKLGGTPTRYREEFKA